MAKSRDDYVQDRKESDVYIPSAVSLLAYLFSKELFTESTPDDDMKKASDLTWLRSSDVGGKHIALRVRKADVWGMRDYRYDFTLRARRGNGVETEFSKIVVKGYGDYLLYAHADPGKPRRLAHHWLVNLERFRFFYYQGMIKPPKEISNGDGTYFYPFDVRKMPQGVVMYGSDAELCGDKITPTPKPRNLFTAPKAARGKAFTENLFPAILDEPGDEADEAA